MSSMTHICKLARSLYIWNAICNKKLLSFPNNLIIQLISLFPWEISMSLFSLEIFRGIANHLFYHTHIKFLYFDWQEKLWGINFCSHSDPFIYSVGWEFQLELLISLILAILNLPCGYS